MRIVYLGNNFLGYQVLEWLKDQGEEIVGLVMHPLGRQQYGTQTVNVSGLEEKYIFGSSQLRCPQTLEAIADLKPDLCISVLYGYILKPEFLDIFPAGCINLHPAFLPYNRGAYPNVWSIIEGTPAGVTIHYIDAGIDTGEILAQTRVEQEPVDTGMSLYHKLEEAGLELFIQTWPKIQSGEAPRAPQLQSGGTYHRAGDVENIDCIDLDQRYDARYLIDLLRARTFHPHRGAYFEEGGKRVYLRLELNYSDDLAE